MGIPEMRERNRWNIWSSAGLEFSKTNDRDQTTDSGSSEDIELFVAKNLYLNILYTNCRKKQGENPGRRQREKYLT